VELQSKFRLGGVTLLVLTGCLVCVPSFSQSKNHLPDFSCATFSPTETHADLAARFGTENVIAAPILGGGAEGEYNEGTVAFANDSDSRVEIFWKDRAGKGRPEWIRIQGQQSRWKSPEGLTLGTDLKTVERINRRPFVLAGLGFDGAGAVLSWQGGKLQSVNGAECQLKIWLRPSESRPNNQARVARQRLANEVARDRNYSSGHPAMQALNPQVYQMMLLYGR
jgi:hypothetical protein